MNINLLPRYNWDYKLKDLLLAYTSLFFTPFTKELSNYQKDDPIFTTSGRASLYTILKSLSLPEGSKIGVPLFCCPIIFETIKAAKLVPEFIDINLRNYCLSLTDLSRKKNSLKAVVVVNLFGNPSDIEAIKNTVPDIIVIEDCAQSLFSRYYDANTGSRSDVSFFSFRLGKYISAGEGSIIICNNSSLKEKIKQISEQFENRTFLDEIVHPVICFGKSIFYHRPLFGVLGLSIGKILDNYLNVTNKTGLIKKKMYKSDFHLISKKFQRIETLINRQRENSFFLLEKINPAYFVLPTEEPNSKNNYLFFPIRCTNKGERDVVSSFLYKSGIDTGKYLEDIKDQVKEYSYKNDCPNSELCSDTVLTIPNYYTLERKDLEHIAASLNRAGDLIRKAHAN